MARGRGEGSISKRPDGRWCARISTGYDDEGNLKRKAFYGKTRKEVHDKMTAALNEMSMNKGRYVDPKKTTLADWLDEWLEVYKSKNLRNGTFHLYYRCIETRIKPFFGKITLYELKPIMIQKFVNHLFDKRYSQTYLKGICIVLHQALEQAVKDDLISKNPAALVKMPKKTDNIRREVLTPEEQACFIEEAQKYNQYGEVFLLMLATGMRIGEVLALTWDDVDFENAEISITKCATRLRKAGDLATEIKTIAGTPKTKSSMRTIPILNSAMK